ncbi:hypothetical protein TIFTF001_039360 [Ficus carica]|uniref:Uncharacterized protein n=1 Tax=Ficus carica TaxID=3494 RepID=A0AA88E9D8_FICCA|nr:hypothetical protein TIFTF001_039360 [Ficus carica]
MSFNEQEGTCSCTLRRSSLTQDIAREEVVLAERKLTVLRLCCSRGVTPTLVSDCISRAIRAEYWINQDKEARAYIFKAKKEERAAERQLQPRQNQDAYAKGQISNVVQHSKQFGKNKGREMLLARVSREITLKRKVTEAMRVITIMIIQCAHNAGRSTLEYVDWGQMLATFVARKVITRGIVPSTTRTRTPSIRTGM